MITFAVVTHAYQEHDLLPQFMRHYEAMGASAVLVLHDLGDQMDDDAIVRERTLMRHHLHSMGHDYVLMPDADEFIVPTASTILEQLQTMQAPERGVLFCEGYTMVLHRRKDYRYTHDYPLVEQRRWGYADPSYSKPIILRSTADGIHRPGFHSFVSNGETIQKPDKAPFILAHMSAIDEDIAVRRRMLRRQRCGEIQHRRGHGVHNWEVTPESIREWVREMGARKDLVKVL